jgi:hypothetical protein
VEHYLSSRACTSKLTDLGHTTQDRKPGSLGNVAGVPGFRTARYRLNRDEDEGVCIPHMADGMELKRWECRKDGRQLRVISFGRS